MSYSNSSDTNLRSQAWLDAYPSQINDSFYIKPEGAGSLERILAFGLDLEAIQPLIDDYNQNKKLSTSSNLVLVYGLDQGKNLNTPPTFSISVQYDDGRGNVSDAYPLHPLSNSTLSSYLSQHIAQKDGNEKPLDSDLQRLTEEVIPIYFEHLLCYAWRSCESSALVDQVEAMDEGVRKRIKRSIYDNQVCSLLAKQYAENDNNVATVLLMGLHPVIPDGKRIFPFGPVLQSYIPGTPQDNLDDLQSNSNSNEDIEEGSNVHATNYELSKPCPPSC